MERPRPTVALILGYVGTRVTEARRDSRARALADAQRHAARSEVAEDRQREFELDYLLKAHAARRALGRFVVRTGDSGPARSTTQISPAARTALKSSIAPSQE